MQRSIYVHISWRYVDAIDVITIVQGISLEYDSYVQIPSFLHQLIKILQFSFPQSFVIEQPTIIEIFSLERKPEYISIGLRRMCVTMVTNTSGVLRPIRKHF